MERAAPGRLFRPHHLLLGLALLLGLISAGVFASERRGRHGDVTLALPLTAGRALHMQIWTKIPDLSMDIDGGVPRIYEGPLAVTIWYEDAARASITRLLTFLPPTWPIVALAGGAGIASMALLAAERRRASTGQPRQSGDEELRAAAEREQTGAEAAEAALAAREAQPVDGRGDIELPEGPA